MKAFFTGLGIACVAALGTYFVFETTGISAVEYRKDRSIHVDRQTPGTQMGSETRNAMARVREADGTR